MAAGALVEAAGAFLCFLGAASPRYCQRRDQGLPAPSPAAPAIRRAATRARTAAPNARRVPRTVQIALSRSGVAVVRLEPERHRGTLRVIADPRDVIQLDGKVVGTGLWEGDVPSGRHSVLISGAMKHPQETDIGRARRPDERRAGSADGQRKARLRARKTQDLAKTAYGRWYAKVVTSSAEQLDQDSASVVN